MKYQKKVNIVNRKIHHKLAMWCALPVFIIITSGLVLQLKKEFSWIQPPTRQGTAYKLNLSTEDILAIAKSIPEASINSWRDINRLDIRPSKGLVKVRAKNRWEIQIDMATGYVLQTSYRRSDLIESIHDGSFFHDYARLGLFLPAGLVLVLLWLTGVIIFINNWIVRRRARQSKKKD